MMSILIVFLINLSAVPYCIWIHSLWIVRTRKRARLVILTSSDLPSPYIKGDSWLVAKELIMWLRCKNVTSYSPSHAKRKSSIELRVYGVTTVQGHNQSAYAMEFPSKSYTEGLRERSGGWIRSHAGRITEIVATAVAAFFWTSPMCFYFLIYNNKCPW